jgi:hypothetical protein
VGDGIYNIKSWLAVRAVKIEYQPNSKTEIMTGFGVMYNELF